MALKLDMSKAYDRLEWGYIRAMLERMGFDGRWINLVMFCVSSVSFSIVHGGQEMGPIVASRGIRHGDPLSHYLFILCAEGFSSLLRSYEQSGLLTGCRIARHAPNISHMLFADDSYIYCKATEEEAYNIKELLHTFELASGQKINFLKSSVFYSCNTAVRFRDTICDLLGIFKADENGSYLGLPYSIGRMLSRAGKEVLLKSVAQALPSYAMNVFLLPVDTCKELERLMAKFWWSTGSSQTKGKSWMSWSRMCRHKHAGGLGFRDLRDFNLALLGKQGWRLLTHNSSLVGRVFKAKYYPATTFLKAELGDNPSFVWRSIVEAKDLLASSVGRSIGTGEFVSILNDPWLPAENPFVISNHSALINQPLSDNTLEDRWCWKFEKHGEYTVNNAYKHLQVLKGAWPAVQPSNLWRTIWDLKVPLKVCNFLWRDASGCLLSCIQLQKRHVPISVISHVCKVDNETIFHALVACPVARSCWNRSLVDVGSITDDDFYNWLQGAVYRGKVAELEELAMVAWAIWRARNEVVW
uniref:Reverse transcriptase domain-containing protein n=1 Tax=Cannabis sativa TaxID=3483 RepID=A0A803NLX6_CANSA